eukprot:TRINITY_DN5813_c0_g7_i1.p1 TRINITY_DN5813_c0_g7~~TRINITY_DN5813_c0_g7_i1.p1  ORF type:complete len:172 (-),score=26.68 TRINITY_DN5813_c0_g7_i1:137-652(-)
MCERATHRPSDAFRETLKEFPWPKDDKAGSEFRKMTAKVQAVFVAAEEAMQLKAVGNKAFGAQRYTEALDAWARGRDVLQREKISGHHLAVFWSNEALLHKRQGDLEGCRRACEAGLDLYCAPSVRAKLKSYHAECSASLRKTSDLKQGFFEMSKEALYGRGGSVQVSNGK